MELEKSDQLLELDTWGFIILCCICVPEMSYNKKYSKTKQKMHIYVSLYLYIICREIEIYFKVLDIRDCGPVTHFILPRIWNGAGI